MCIEKNILQNTVVLGFDFEWGATNSTRHEFRDFFSIHEFVDKIENRKPEYFIAHYYCSTQRRNYIYYCKITDDITTININRSLCKEGETVGTKTVPYCQKIENYINTINNRKVVQLSSALLSTRALQSFLGEFSSSIFYDSYVDNKYISWITDLVVYIGIHPNELFLKIIEADSMIIFKMLSAAARYAYSHFTDRSNIYDFRYKSHEILRCMTEEEAQQIENKIESYFKKSFSNNGRLRDLVSVFFYLTRLYNYKFGGVVN